MTVHGVLSHIVSLQREPNLRMPDIIHDANELAFVLQDRDDAERAFCDAFGRRRAALMTVPHPLDRTKYPAVVFSGLKGLGKTRMLEEWPRLFKAAGIPEPHLGVLVMYGNGHGPQLFENEMPIEAAFSWRMLHRLLLEDNVKNTGAAIWHKPEYLPANACALTLDVAVDVIRVAAEQGGLVQSDQVLSLFIGVDEYQAILHGTNYVEPMYDRGRSWLRMLLAGLQECSVACKSVHIYPAFAGTKWGPMSLARSSLADVVSAPMRLLRPQRVEDAIFSHPDYRAKLVSPEFRRNLFFFGGLARPSIEYAMGQTFEDVWNLRVTAVWRDVGTNDLLQLIASAVSGLSVKAEDASGIMGFKWQRLCDQGMCLFMEDMQVVVPYCLFKLAADIDILTVSSLAAKCLLQNLRFLRDHVDRVVYDLEPWQLWEKFGACFFALRVNALLMLGNAKIAFNELCRGSFMNGCTQEVLLEPTEVHSIGEPVSVNLGTSVTETKDRRELNWLDNDGGIRYVLLNGTGGTGVNIFCLIKLANGGRLLYLDQRKRDAKSLGIAGATKLLNKAAVVPECVADAQIIVGLFSLLASFREANNKDLPVNTFVLSFLQLEKFYGCLASHPACCPLVDVNFANVTTLRLLKSVSTIAEQIISRRLKTKFATVEDFANFCKENSLTLSCDDWERVVAFSNN